MVKTISKDINHAKRKFSQVELENAFNGNFSILDILNKNEGIIDSSTIYSALQTQHLFTQEGFKSNTEVRTVIATCINSHNLKDLTKEAQRFIENSQRATGNTVCDLVIDGHHYDYKTLSASMSLAKNHIIFISFDDLNKAHINLYNLSLQFKNLLRSQTDPYNIEYITHAQKELASLVNKKEISLMERTKRLYDSLQKQLNVYEKYWLIIILIFLIVISQC